MDEYLRIIQFQEKTAERNDKINRRLITALISISITAWLVAGAVCLMYFGIDYSYPEFNQSQEQSAGEINQSQQQGGD